MATVIVATGFAQYVKKVNIVLTIAAICAIVYFKERKTLPIVKVRRYGQVDTLEILNLLEKPNIEETFGNRIRMVRRWLNYSQDQFAHVLCINSRISVVNAEKATSVKDVNTETLYRLYYFMAKLSSAQRGYADFMVDLINDINITVDVELSTRISDFYNQKVSKSSSSLPSNDGKNKQKNKQLTEC